MKQSRLIGLICSALIFLFGYTAISKLLGYQVFRVVLETMPVIKPFAQWISWLLPAVELVIALFLILPKYRLEGLTAAFVLMTLLTGYLLWMIMFHKERPCNCGGVLQMLSWKQHVVFNLFFTALAATGMELARRHRRLVNRFLHT